MNVLSLFSGIGGIELGLERAGMRTVGQVELNAWCRSVLAKHWPNVPQHDDVLTAPEWWASEERPCVDVVAGGFPCQPFSQGGLQKGMDDERWMWPAMADVVRATRPRYVVVENVAALVRDGWAWGTVLADLHSLGFDAEWATLSANQFGAPHIRERVYLVAYAPRGDGQDQDESTTPWTLELEPGGGRGEHGGRDWIPEPSMDRVAHGVPRRLVHDELHALGNSVVPPIFEHIGRQIMKHAKAVAA
ncbi:DNA (cytosine-5-)-methyltransferase [Microbacterium sp. R1]|uniref:Cytosine-specific methyltransferase n=1 Tax=Microbacterium phage vB_MoxS-R1 TaxID=2848881 RepID=A0A8F2E4S3_9CAUD|nr:DNA (cytosine-5-)-methyltransferase [Microbacterium sp. R1]YP_010649909.1 DNA methyltransferase [Microbacterium phage vB_MoxS-R1]MBE7953601.1 DNA (cytosine-5-)-methyltransferase [Microbacterium sp. R1]QWT28879.1 DNA methyltransferase [Microbacterium phage vB_MoxS-R1]